MKLRAQDMKKDDIAAMTEEEIMAMEPEEIMAMDPEEIYAEEVPGDSAAAIEEVVEVVDQRQALVDELASLQQRVDEINGMIAEMDAAAVATIEEAVSEPAVTEGEPDPIRAEGEMDDEEKVKARRKAMKKMASRARSEIRRKRAA